MSAPASGSAGGPGGPGAPGQGGAHPPGGVASGQGVAQAILLRLHQTEAALLTSRPKRPLSSYDLFASSLKT